MKTKYLPALLIGALASFIAYATHQAFADQPFLNHAATARATRACAFTAQHAKVVALSSTTAASSTLAEGNVRVLCTQDAHFYQGAVGVTGPTAGTGDTFLAAKSPEYLYNPGTNKIAFLRDSADGTCFVSECQ